MLSRSHPPARRLDRARARFKPETQPTWPCFATCCLRPSTPGAPTPRPGWTLITTSPPTWPACWTPKNYKVVRVQLGREAPGPASTASPRCLPTCAIQAERHPKPPARGAEASCQSRSRTPAAGANRDSPLHPGNRSANRRHQPPAQQEPPAANGPARATPSRSFTYQTLSKKDYERFLGGLSGTIQRPIGRSRTSASRTSTSSAPSARSGIRSPQPSPSRRHRTRIASSSAWNSTTTQPSNPAAPHSRARSLSS